MDLLDEFKDMIKYDGLLPSANYYFENHECGGKTVKVMMDYKLCAEYTDKIIKFGKCNNCGKMFYHQDYESRTV